MRAFVFLVALLISADGYAERIFVPVDESGQALVDTDDVNGLPKETSLTAPSEETPQERIAREAREHEHLREVEMASETYADCLKSEADRLLGPDYSRCDGSRGRLQGLYAREVGATAISCLEIAVLGKARDGKETCPFALTKAPDTTNARRWK